MAARLACFFSGCRNAVINDDEIILPDGFPPLPGEARGREDDEEEEAYLLEAYMNPPSGLCQRAVLPESAQRHIAGACSVNDDEKEDTDDDVLLSGRDMTVDFCSPEGLHAATTPGLNDIRQKPPSLSLEKELSVLVSNSRLLPVRKFDVVHLHGEHYCINGRHVCLHRLLEDSHLPDFSHHCDAFGFEVAQRAASIVVHDGAMQQPLLDYLLQPSVNSPAAGKTECTLADADNDDRVEAMLQATAQACADRKFVGRVGGPSRYNRSPCRSGSVGGA